MPVEAAEEAQCWTLGTPAGEQHVGEATGPGKSVAGPMCRAPRAGEHLLPVSIIIGYLWSRLCSQWPFLPWKGTDLKEQLSHLHLKGLESH